MNRFNTIAHAFADSWIRHTSENGGSELTDIIYECCAKYHNKGGFK